MGEMSWLVAVIAFAATAVLALYVRRGGKANFDKTVFEWQRGLIYQDGKFEREVGPGRYWLFRNRQLYAVTTSQQMLTAHAQEVLTADRMQVKLTGVLTYSVSEPRRLFEATMGSYTDALHLDLQLALREIAVTRSLEKLIDDRPALDAEYLALVKKRSEPRGITVLSATLRDVILSADLRRLYSETERTRLEGLAALERARGEQAALRSLANSARMLKGNPELMNLRLLQALAAQPGKAAPTIVLGGGTGLLPVQSHPAPDADA